MKHILKNHVAECREALKIKNWQLARRLGKSRAYVTRLEQGQIQPSLSAALVIAAVLGKRVEEVFEFVPDGESQPANPVGEAIPSKNFPFALPSALGNQSNPTEKKTRKEK